MSKIDPRKLYRIATHTGTRLICTVAVVVCCAGILSGENSPTISAKTKEMQKMEGFFPLYWDAKGGKLWLEIDRWDIEFLYVHSLPAGVGSNDIGLDRGQIGDSRVVRFYRSGPRVLLIQSNYSYRATSNDPIERKTVEESFAQSVLWGFDVAAEEGTRILTDATGFFLNDVHNVAATIKETKQGDFKPDPSKSAVYLPRTKTFPKNTEVEVILTFTGENPGNFLRDVAPTAKSFSVREHHSLIELPDDRYETREFDPRSGYSSIRFLDFGTEIGEPLARQFVIRHRLKKKHPESATSEPVEPIIYYMDPGAPEPIRSALIDGASWWNKAFEAAGFKNAFQVKLLPPDADPMDVRYNVIQWVHRATRGWSYGNAIYDPRTGEILKGHVTLGSQRVRQDYMIAESLLAPYQTDKPQPDPMLQMSLDRLRQLSAHEVGHTIGLTHNFAASISNRASVMDYPHPVVKIKPDGNLDLSDAYAKGVGEWDKAAIVYGYSDFPEATDTKVALDKILHDAHSRGLRFIADEDARPVGGAHPQAHLWDNSADAIAELEHILKVRNVALRRFGEANIRKGTHLARLEEVLVPLYLFHRYQTTAVAKLLAGVDYNYALRDDGQLPVAIVPARTQIEALSALLKTIHPDALALPEKVFSLIPPMPHGFNRGRESFQMRTGLPFDALAPAESAANLTIGLVFHPERMARLLNNHANAVAFPGPAEVIEQVFASSWKSPRQSGYHAEIQRTVNSVVLYYLMNLSIDQTTPVQVRAIAFQKLRDLDRWLKLQKPSSSDVNWKAFYNYTTDEIARFMKEPKTIGIPKPADLPPGAPIGCE